MVKGQIVLNLFSSFNHRYAGDNNHRSFKIERCCFINTFIIQDETFGKKLPKHVRLIRSENLSETSTLSKIYGLDSFTIRFDFCYIKYLLIDSDLGEKLEMQFSNMIIQVVNFVLSINSTLSFYKTSFLDRVNMPMIPVKSKVQFHECKFQTFNCYNTKFRNLIDFYKSEFFAPTQFHLTDFMDRAVFSQVIFRKEVQFLYCRTRY